MAAHPMQNEARLLLEQGRTHLNSTDEAPALGYFQRALALLELENDSSLKADVLNTLGLTYDRRGRRELAVGCFERARAVAENVGDARLVAMTEHNLGLMQFRRGRWEAALQRFERAEATLREPGARFLPLTVHFAAAAHERLGRHERAMELYGRALELLADGSNPRERAKVYANMAWLHRRCGRHHAAYVAFTEALRELRASGSKGGRRIALHAVAQALRVGRPLDAARFSVQLLSRRA